MVEKHLIGPLWTDNAHESRLFIRVDETEPSHAAELVATLTRWLELVGDALPAEPLSLSGLLDRAIQPRGVPLVGSYATTAAFGRKQ